MVGSVIGPGVGGHSVPAPAPSSAVTATGRDKPSSGPKSDARDLKRVRDAKQSGQRRNKRQRKVRSIPKAFQDSPHKRRLLTKNLHLLLLERGRGGEAMLAPDIPNETRQNVMHYARRLASLNPVLYGGADVMHREGAEEHVALDAKVFTGLIAMKPETQEQQFQLFTALFRTCRGAV